MTVRIVLGILAVVLGLAASYRWGTAAGATVAGTSVALFFVVLAVQELLGACRRPVPAAA